MGPKFIEIQITIPVKYIWQDMRNAHLKDRETFLKIYMYICFEKLKKNRKKSARNIRGEIGKGVLDSFVDLLREKSYGSSKE